MTQFNHNPSLSAKSRESEESQSVNPAVNNNNIDNVDDENLLINNKALIKNNIATGIIYHRRQHNDGLWSCTVEIPGIFFKMDCDKMMKFVRAKEAENYAAEMALCELQESNRPETSSSSRKGLLVRPSEIQNLNLNNNINKSSHSVNSSSINSICSQENSNTTTSQVITSLINNTVLNSNTNTISTNSQVLKFKVKNSNLNFVENLKTNNYLASMTEEGCSEKEEESVPESEEEEVREDSSSRVNGNLLLTRRNDETASTATTDYDSSYDPKNNNFSYSNSTTTTTTTKFAEPNLFSNPVSSSNRRTFVNPLRPLPVAFAGSDHEDTVFNFNL